MNLWLYLQYAQSHLHLWLFAQTFQNQNTSSSCKGICCPSWARQGILLLGRCQCLDFTTQEIEKPHTEEVLEISQLFLAKGLLLVLVCMSCPNGEPQKLLGVGVLNHIGLDLVGQLVEEEAKVDLAANVYCHELAVIEQPWRSRVELEIEI